MRKKLGSRVSWGWGWCLQDLRIFFDSSDLVKAAHLSVCDPNFEIHSLSHHLTNKSIILTPFPFIRKLKMNVQNCHCWKHCCVRCHKNWFHSFHLLLHVNPLFLLATWMTKALKKFIKCFVKPNLSACRTCNVEWDLQVLRTIFYSSFYCSHFIPSSPFNGSMIFRKGEALHALKWSLNV